MNEDERLARARRAESILKDPIVTEAFDEIEAEILDRWKNAPNADREGQHELKLMMHVLKSFREIFERAVNEGKVIIHRAEERKRFHLFGRKVNE